jgi:hypothetical protein
LFTGFATAASGILISIFGHYIPLMLIGSSLATIGAGLFILFGQYTPSSLWIPFQAIQGIGIGLCFQVPVIVAQATSTPDDVSSATAMVFLVQAASATIFISVAQNLFANRFLQAILQLAMPGSIDPGVLLVTGATELRSKFPESMLPVILESYMIGLRNVFIFLTVIAGIAFVISIFVLIFDWKKLNVEGEDGANVAIGG